MSNIVLFHSARGLTDAVLAWAKALRDDGHVVHAPDLFDGETFRDLAAGVAKRDALGIPELMRRAQAAVARLPGDCVYAGFSMGAAAAQSLALTRPGARKAVLMHAALPLAAFGAASWPGDVPLQIHTSERDPWVDQTVIDELEKSAHAVVFRYPGAGHLFADPSDADFDAASAALMLERVRAFVRAG